MKYTSHEQFRNSKSISRQYRKTLGRLGVKGVPYKGAFHVVDEYEQHVAPENVERQIQSRRPWRIVKGPLPYSMPVHPDLSKRQPYAPIPADSIFSDVEQLPTVFKRIVRECTDKRRTDYRPVKNPKPNQVCYVKAIVGGKCRWVETTYGSHLNTMQLA